MKYKLATIMFLLFSCQTIKVEKTYKLGMADYRLLNNHEYEADYKMMGIEKGFWHRNNDTLILKSEFDKDSIKQVNILSSSSNIKDSTVMYLLLSSTNTCPYYANIIYNNKLIKDTLKFHRSIRERNIIPKNSDLITFKINVTYLTDSVLHTATSDFYKSKMTDTIFIYYNYPDPTRLYHFHKNDKYLIMDNFLKKL
jgi:hypothetical protein